MPNSKRGAMYRRKMREKKRQKRLVADVIQKMVERPLPVSNNLDKAWESLRWTPGFIYGAKN